MTLRTACWHQISKCPRCKWISERTACTLPEIDLWLDNTEPCAATWISHGHSDHARGCHGRVIATSATLRFYRMRLWMQKISKSRKCSRWIFGQSMDWNGAKLTAYPASHILGAAQILIEFGGERLVYTGDIKLRTTACRQHHASDPLRSSDYRIYLRAADLQTP